VKFHKYWTDTKDGKSRVRILWKVTTLVQRKKMSKLPQVKT
jgi:hypothetical protein